MFRRTLEMFPTLEQYLKMMQVESVCSEVSSFILRTAHFLQRSSSLQYTSRLRKAWQERKLSSVHLILEQISR